MRDKVFPRLRTWSYIIFAISLLLPVGLGAAEWAKVDYTPPKDDEGNPEGVNTVAIVGKNNVYFGIGGSRLVHWDGKAFKEIKHSKSGNAKWDIRNIVINSEKDIWVFGDNGLSLHSTGMEWNTVKNPMTGKGRRDGRLWGSGCATPKKCFAGTRAGDLIEWDGKEWKLVAKAGDPPAEGARIYAMAFPSKSEGWMAGEAFLAKWDGKKWMRSDAEVPRIYDMTIVGNDFGWIVGDGGHFSKFDGKSWAKFDVKGSFFRMRGVSCASKSDCWAVGDAGAAFQWDGKAWKKVKIGTFDRFNRVHLAHGMGFMVTDKGGIYQLK